MQNAIYKIGAHGMERIDVSANHFKNNLPMGTVLKWTGNQAWHEQEYCIVSRNESSYGVAYGLISLETYQDTQIESYAVKEAGENICQDFILIGKTLKPDEILDLVEKNKIKKVHQEEAKNLEALRKQNEKAEHVKNHPYLTPLSAGGTASKNIKIELKRAFPSIKFSVRQDHCINVNWDNGPTVEEVKKITGKYEEGSFDGMTDSYDYNHRQTWTDVFGGDRYVFEHRNVSDDIYEAILRERCRMFGEEYKGLEYRYEKQGGYGSTLAGRHLNHISLVDGFKVQMVEETLNQY